MLRSEHDENQTGAPDPCSQYPGQHSKQQIPGEIHPDTLTLFFTLSVNEHMMHKVSNNNKSSGIITVFLPTLQ